MWRFPHARPVSNLRLQTCVLVHLFSSRQLPLLSRPFVAVWPVVVMALMDGEVPTQAEPSTSAQQRTAGSTLSLA